MQTELSQRKTNQRLVTWIDGVGGYLICLGDEVTLGQPAGAGGAEISILADLSRRHATILRERESYVLTPIHPVHIDGTEQQGPVVLKNNTLIELAKSVRLRFRQPHALSSTAVLTLESHHKTEPAVDGIILMSESCVLGPNPHSHIPCRHWKEDLVLFRRGEDLRFRTDALSGIINNNTRIEDENFAMSFEIFD